MPATGAVEVLAMLATILLVLRRAMPATGAVEKLALPAGWFSDAVIETGHAHCWTLL